MEQWRIRKQHIWFDLPNHPEIITIKVEGLHSILVVLENNFDEIVESCRQYRSSNEGRAIGGKALEGIYRENTRDVEVISKL